MENNMDTNNIKALTKRLDALIYIMLNNRNEDLALLKDQVKLLDNLNFRPIEIAEILSKTQTHISKELATIRKSTKGKQNGQKKRAKIRK